MQTGNLTEFKAQSPRRTWLSALVSYSAPVVIGLAVLLFAEVVVAQTTPITATSVVTVTELLIRENQAVLNKSALPIASGSPAVATSRVVQQPQPISVTVNAVYGDGDLLKADLTVNMQARTVTLGSTLGKCLVTEIAGKCVRLDMVQSVVAKPKSTSRNSSSKKSKTSGPAAANICPARSCWVGEPYVDPKAKTPEGRAGLVGLPAGLPRPIAPLPPAGFILDGPAVEVVQGIPPAN